MVVGRMNVRVDMEGAVFLEFRFLVIESWIAYFAHRRVALLSRVIDLDEAVIIIEKISRRVYVAPSGIHDSTCPKFDIASENSWQLAGQRLDSHLILIVLPHIVLLGRFWWSLALPER